MLIIDHRKICTWGILGIISMRRGPSGRQSFDCLRVQKHKIISEIFYLVCIKYDTRITN